MFFRTANISRVTQIKTYSWDNAQVILVRDRVVFSFESKKKRIHLLQIIQTGRQQV